MLVIAFENTANAGNVCETALLVVCGIMKKVLKLFWPPSSSKADSIDFANGLNIENLVVSNASPDNRSVAF